MSTELKSAFWKRMGDVRACMLDAGHNRYVPMAPYADQDANAIWFITAAGTDVEESAQGGKPAHMMVSDAKADLYAHVEGTMVEVNDPEKLDEIWNGVAAAWFEDGRDDEKVRLVKMTPAKAEIWATGSNAGFLYEIFKARVTEDTPDVGEHGTVSF